MLLQMNGYKYEIKIPAEGVLGSRIFSAGIFDSIMVDYSRFIYLESSGKQDLKYR